MRKVLILVSFLLMTACAGSHEIKGSGEAYDPWEGYNRAIFKFNEGYFL